MVLTWKKEGGKVEGELREADMKKRIEDMNEIQDPEELKAVDWDAVHANEEGEDPVEEVALSPEDFKVVETPVDVLAMVKAAITDAVKRPLGGPIVPSTLKGYCTVSVAEVEARERG